MKRVLNVALLCIVSACGTAEALEPADLAGCWEGKRGAGQQARRVILSLAVEGEEISGRLYVYDRTSEELAVRSLAATDSTILLIARSAQTDTLTLGAAGPGLRLTGSMTAREGSRALALERVEPLPEEADRFLGAWSGRLEAFALSLVLHVREGACGRYEASLDSPDQGALGLACTAFAIDADSLAFELEYLNASFTGVLDSAGDAVDGQFVQHGARIPLRLQRGEAIAPLNRPQEPKPPFPYREETVTIDNVEAGIHLAGTLTLPEGEGPHPAVILISGSGPQDRNEELLGHKPFLVLADDLTRRGVAVLRTDDRGVGGSSGDSFQSTLEDLAGDALAQVGFLKRRTDVDPGKIGLVGHSEGGWVAPMAAARSHDVAFIVLLAGPAVGGEALLRAQSVAMQKARGVSETIIALSGRYRNVMYEALREEVDLDRIRSRILEGWQAIESEQDDATLAAFSEAVGMSDMEVSEWLDVQLETMLTPWFRYLFSYDPQPVLSALEIPVLVVIGEKDVQVPPAVNLPAFERLLKASEREDVAVLELSGLNHLFQTATTGSLDEYGTIEETFSPRALQTIGQWIVDVTESRIE